MNVDFIAIISVAFLSSFGHCYAMCGGLNLALLSLNPKSSFFSSALIYHSFRILAYVFLGLIFGLFSNIFNFFPQSLIFFILGLFMIILGCALIIKGSFLAFFERSFLFDFLRQKFLYKLHLKGYKSIMLLGFLNGFVPCGLVYFHLAIVLNQKDLLNSMLVMLVFGLSTVPALLFFMFFSEILSQKLKQFYTHLAYGIIIIYGVYYLYLALIYSQK